MLQTEIFNQFQKLKAMPEVKYSKTINNPLPDVWNFVKDMNNWAPFMMGYQSHTIINDKDSTWHLKSTIAGVTYSFEMQVTITEWVENDKVKFLLKGLTHPVKGEGLVKLFKNENDTAKTDVEFTIRLKGSGIAGPVVSLVVSPLLKPMAEQLLEKINAKFEGITV